MPSPLLSLLEFRRNRHKQPGTYAYCHLQPVHIRLLRLPPMAAKKNRLFSSDANPTLECELFSKPLSLGVQYEALSYAWGKGCEYREIAIKCVDNHPLATSSSRGILPVTETLHVALRQLQLPSSPRILWIDQICIDQSNEEEKTRQVSIMDEIYKRAQKALIWLGEDDKYTVWLKEMVYHSSDLADREYLNQIRCQLYDDWKHDGHEQERCNAIINLLSRPWFGRAWTYQESVVARVAEIVMGSFRANFDTVARLVLSIYALKHNEHDFWTKSLRRSRGFGNLRGLWYDRKTFQQGKRLDFMHLLWRARKYLYASEPRDMVYAFLAFQGLAPFQRINVTPGLSAIDVYINTTCSMIRNSRNLNVLQCVIGKSISPSWVPNWSDKDLHGSPIIPIGSHCAFDACKGKEHIWIPSQHAQLVVTGHQIDYVTVVHTPSWEYSHVDGSKEFTAELLGLIDKFNVASENLSQCCKPQSNIRPPSSAPRKHVDISSTVLRTILMDGAVADKQNLPEDLMLRLRTVEDVQISTSLGSRNLQDESFIGLLGTVRNTLKGKCIFLTACLDIGLTFSTIQEGDVVFLIHGSKLPCILRKCHLPGIYQFVGLAYVDGWMYGDNPRGWEWWNQQAQRIVLV